MINNPELIKQIIDNIKKLSKEDLDKVMKEADEWYNKEVTDTDVGNIDKDINRCKELIKDKHKEWIGMTNQKAIGNVLQALDRNSAGDIEVTDEKINELDSLILQIEEHSKHRSLSDTYLREHECNTREDIGVGEYAYGIVLVPEDWVLPYLKELSNIWKNKLEKGDLNE